MGSTSLDVSKSNYDADGNVVIHFNVKFDNILWTEKFGKRNGYDYWRAVVAHERGHVQQFMDLAKDLPSKLLKSGMTGDGLDNLFLNTLYSIERAWIKMNSDPGHSDANERAKSFLAPEYWHFLITKPKY